MKKLRIDANRFGNLVSGASRSIYLRILSLPGDLKTGFLEILSQVQHIAGNLSKHNLLNSSRDDFKVKVKKLALQLD